jgi:hypothetical protein
MARMSSAQPLQITEGLLPLTRPLMTGEVLDAAFRLFRAGLLRCLPYSGLAVLVIELPALYSTFVAPPAFGGIRREIGYGVPPEHLISTTIVLLLSAALLGMLTLRLHAVSRGLRPRVRTELAAVMWRWPASLIATLAALGLPLLLIGVGPAFNQMLPGVALLVVGVPLLWPASLFVVALPAFWCDGLGPFAAIAQAFRLTRRQSLRMVGALFATVCMIAVFYVLSAIVVGMLSPLLGRADLFLIATVSSMLSLVVGAFGVPFVLAVLIVAYEDLKLRERERRGTPT